LGRHLRFDTTSNGYPTVTLDTPFEPFAEFLRAAHSPQSAQQLLSAVNAVLAGELRSNTIEQDYGTLTLGHDSSIARVVIENLSQATEDSAEMSLEEFHDIAEQWAQFVTSKVDT
jgi:hypothetical protein